MMWHSTLKLNIIRLLSNAYIAQVEAREGSESKQTLKNFKDGMKY